MGQTLPDLGRDAFEFFQNGPAINFVKDMPADLFAPQQSGILHGLKVS